MSEQIQNNSSIGELVREREQKYVRGTTQISKYVDYSMYETIETIYAYLNSKHISGQKDSQDRDKPFFNICIAAANIWYRATDIDTHHIRVRATKRKDWINSMLANVLLWNWMRKARFGMFLNEWGRVLSRFGSAVIKTVENSEGLILKTLPWSNLIVDSIDFDNNPKIEVLELTEEQLRSNPNYNQDVVEGLISATQERETLDKKDKDDLSHYYKVYEVHGKLPLSNITDEETDEKKFVQQMHVISFVGTKNGKADEYEDFTLYRGREEYDPYMITHLIEDDEKTLSMGAVEHLFDAQWMQNHSVKAIKDQLDLASKQIFQTSDVNFAGQNALSAIENGDILIHAVNQQINRVQNNGMDIVSWQNFAVSWKQLGNEINGISESMLGAQPKPGTAWRQTEAILQENYNLFELMTENKGLHLEELLRTRIIPHIKKKIDTTDEISAILEQHDIDRIDGLYIKSMSTRLVNDRVKDAVLSQDINEPLDPILTPEGQQAAIAETEADIKDKLKGLGNQRFFKPSELDDKTWKKQLENFEWEAEVDVTGESSNVQESLATLNTALQVVVNPGFEQNPKAKRIVGKILELTGAMSPIEYQAIESPLQPVVAQDGSNTGRGLEDINIQQNA